MSFQTMFTVLTGFSVAGWLLLFILPRWHWTARLVLSGFWSLLLCIVYLVLVVRFLPGADGGFDSIAAVRTLFADDALLLAGWVHYLAFDLLVGALEVREARKSGIPHLLVFPALLVTFFLGPIGLLLFYLIKAVRQRKLAEVISG